MATRKKTTKKPVEEKPIEAKPVKQIIKTEAEQRLASLVATAGGVPRIDLNELSPRQIEMEIPKGVKRSEYSYRWIAQENLATSLHRLGNGIWEIVRRHNHSHAPDGVFSESGAIMYKNDVVLCFTDKRVTDKIQKDIADEFNLKTDNQTKDFEKHYHTAAGKGAGVHVEVMDDPGDGVGAEELTTDDDYNYPAPA